MWDGMWFVMEARIGKRDNARSSAMVVGVAEGVVEVDVVAEPSIPSSTTRC